MCAPKYDRPFFKWLDNFSEYEMHWYTYRREVETLQQILGLIDVYRRLVAQPGYNTDFEVSLVLQRLNFHVKVAFAVLSQPSAVG